jgi:RNA polymerase sigma-B factor
MTGEVKSSPRKRKFATAMRDLWIRARNGDRAARERLIERHMPLARSLAVQYRHAREPLDDLIQVANLGLVKAVDRFDPDRGIAFTSYAVPTILGELKRHFRDRTWSIHVSRGVQESIARVDKVSETLRQELGRFPSVAEVAEHCELSVEEVTEARLADNAARMSSLDAPAQREEGDFSELLGRNDAQLARVEDALWIEQLAGELTPREREILRLRFVEDLVQREIAERVGISQMHVSRVLRQALEHLASAA